MKRNLIVFILLSVLSAPCFSLSYENTCNEPYNKPLSVFLSVVSPGMGQIYSGQLDKGLTIWTASTILTASLIVTIADLNFYSIGSPIPVNMGFQLKPELSPDERFWTWGLSITYALLYIYNIVDISVYDNDRARVDVSCENEGFHLNYAIEF